MLQCAICGGETEYSGERFIYVCKVCGTSQRFAHEDIIRERQNDSAAMLCENTTDVLAGQDSDFSESEWTTLWQRFKNDKEFRSTYSADVMYISASVTKVMLDDYITYSMCFYGVYVA